MVLTSKPREGRLGEYRDGQLPWEVTTSKVDLIELAPDPSASRARTLHLHCWEVHVPVG